MSDRSAEFVQAPIEDVEWDRCALGAFYDSYIELLPTEQRFGDAGNAASSLLQAVTSSGLLAPLQQVLLANALVTGLTREDPRSTAHALTAVRGARFRASRAAEALAATAPLLAVVLGRLRGDAQLALPFDTIGHRTAWAPLNSLYLSKLSALFDDGASVLLHGAGAAGRLDPLRRQQLNGLLFHPLQNADQHGRHPVRAWSFSGVATRVVDKLDPGTPSFAEYRAALAEHDTGAFLEVVVHDNGIGIASHFYSAKRNPGDPDLFMLPLFNEWQTLLHAFERHQTSKPNSFRRLTTQVHSTPGVGLAGLLSALKHLHAYLELRTGRLRLFQWYRGEDVIPDRLLLQPAGLPAAAPTFPGTVFRMLIPLAGGETRA